ncbi:MAG: hypothetical protein ACOY94_12500 [Bacillota bacterium]
MSRIFLGLSSREGDRLGHLVRGVQMLRSYGHEADIEGYSDVVSLVLKAEEEPSFACVLSGESGATFEALQGICRETEWALGKQPETLTVWILQHGERRPGKAPRAFEAIRAGRLEAGMTRVMEAGEFRRICDWGQEIIGDESDVIGEWPSATGR